MTVEEGLEFFSAMPKIKIKLQKRLLGLLKQHKESIAAE
jgi:hypothetical protein